MGVAKYSPTVTASYGADQKWWYKNGGDYGNGTNPASGNDNDGYDSYGYSDKGEDRSGHAEEDYNGVDDDFGDPTWPLYDRVAQEWDKRLLGTLAPLPPELLRVEA